MVDSESDSANTKSNVNESNQNTAQTDAVPGEKRSSSLSLNHDYQPPPNSQIPGQFNYYEQHYRRISEDTNDETHTSNAANRSNSSVYKNTLPRLSFDAADDAKKHSKSNGGSGDNGGGGGGNGNGNEYNEKTTSFTPIANSVAKADFEQAIELTGYGKFHYLLLAICGLVSTSEEMDVISMSFILPSAQCDLELNTQTKGWLNSIIFIGMMAGAYMWGSIADTLGRRKVLIVISFMNAICIVASSFCQSYLLFMIFRFLNGVA